MAMQFQPEYPLVGRHVVDQDKVGAMFCASLLLVAIGLVCRLSMGWIPILVMLDFGTLLRSALLHHRCAMAAMPTIQLLGCKCTPAVHFAWTAFIGRGGKLSEFGGQRATRACLEPTGTCKGACSRTTQNFPQRK